jgi:hypothetical protein
VHRTSAGIRPHFRDSGPNGGFGVWWLLPPNPAAAGNACRWAAPNQDDFHFARTSNLYNGDEDMQIQRKKSTPQHQQVPSLSRKDRLSRSIRVGDWVRLVEIPASIADMPHETQLVFKKAIGKTFRIESFNEYDLAELNLSQKVARNNYIWVEPEYLLLFRRKQVK